MNKILTFIFLLPFLVVSINSINEEQFINNINDAYNEYEVILDEEREIGDLTVVFGTYKDKYYLSCFLLNNGTSANHYIKVYLDSKLTTYVPDGGVVEGYKLQVRNEDTIKIVLSTDATEIVVKEFKVSDLKESLKTNQIVGNGLGTFPKNKREISLINQIRLYIFGFFFLAVALGIALVIMYKKAIGRFNKNHREKPLFDFEQEDKDYDDDVIDVASEVENEETYEQNKQEVMDRLFEEFRKGDITEDELNEKLKKLWWKNNE